MSLAATILSILLALLFLVAGSPKVMDAKSSQKLRDNLHVNPTLWKTVGALEALAAIGLIAGIFIPPLGLAAATGLALLMAGAIITHLRAHDTKGALGVIPLLITTAAAAILLILATQGHADHR